MELNLQLDNLMFFTEIVINQTFLPLKFLIQRGHIMEKHNRMKSIKDSTILLELNLESKTDKKI